ncbi:secreted protein [Candidatus Magnetobacterium bavaricum]|uniref:Secreted protein n=1 Tax=Candidatus Magnetobacterium bavaricum TaxID=29290 RepID=A0A0F3GWC5_9BACT|nr:secreted protein [Candidatus Magnetobacterium bavaricum]
MSLRIYRRVVVAIFTLLVMLSFVSVSQSFAQCQVVIKKNVKVPWTVYKKGEVRNSGWFMFTDTPRSNGRLIIQYSENSGQELNLFGDYGKNWIKITNTVDKESWEADTDDCQGNTLRGHIIRDGHVEFDFTITTTPDTPVIPLPLDIPLPQIKDLPVTSTVENARYHDSRTVVNYSEAPRSCKGRPDEKCYLFSQYTAYVEPDGSGNEVIRVYSNLNPVIPHLVLRDAGSFYGMSRDKLFLRSKTDDVSFLEVFDVHSKRSIHKVTASEPMGIISRDYVAYYTEKDRVDNISVCPNKREAFEAKKDGLNVVKEIEVKFNMVDMSVTPTGVFRCAGKY